MIVRSFRRRLSWLPVMTARLSWSRGLAGNAERRGNWKSRFWAMTTPEASVVGEVVPIKEFYDYEAKYLSEGSDLIIPAKLTRQQTKQVQQMAIAAFKACDCSGLARVDFLLDPGETGAHLSERNQYASRLHVDQHVPETLGGIWCQVFRADRPADPACARAARREGSHEVFAPGLGLFMKLAQVCGVRVKSEPCPQLKGVASPHDPARCAYI